MADATTNPATVDGAPAARSAPPASHRRATPLRPGAREVIVVANPNAGARGGGRLAANAVKAAESGGFRVHRVQGFDELAGVSLDLMRRGDLRAVLAVGGDGTVGMALNATPPGTPLVAVPAGTENLLAKYVRPRRALDVGRLLRDGVVVRLDAGEANGRLFALMVSVGFDAEVVRRVHAKRTGNITHLAYAEPIVRAIRNYQYPAVTVEMQLESGEQREAVGRWVFGVNLPRYAQGLPIVPEATGLDGLIDVCTFERGGAAAGLWYLWNIVRRRRHRLKSVSAARCRRFRIRSPETDVPYQLDGDPGGVLPLEVRAVPGRLTLLVPRSTADRLGFETADSGESFSPPSHGGH